LYNILRFVIEAFSKAQVSLQKAFFDFLYFFFTVPFGEVFRAFLTRPANAVSADDLPFRREPEPFYGYFEFPLTAGAPDVVVR
jgi:hypothetical protein